MVETLSDVPNIPAAITVRRVISCRVFFIVWILPSGRRMERAPSPPFERATIFLACLRVISERLCTSFAQWSQKRIWSLPRISFQLCKHGVFTSIELREPFFGIDFSSYAHQI